MPIMQGFSLDRRRLLHATAAAIAAVHAPGWLAAASQRDATISALVLDNNAFALNLFEQLAASNDGNLIVSPYSVSLALAMTYAGAEGDTAEQMAQALTFAIDRDELPAAFRSLTDDLVDRGTAEADKDEQVTARTLSVANALWGEQTFPFDESFTDLLADDYDAPMNLVDFKNDPEGTREEINAWVADKTNNRIENIVPEGLITEAARLVLANAIWFYGAWRYQFDPEDTEEAPFHLLDGESVDVPFMNLHEDFSYASGPTYEAVELPYEGSGFSFLVVMPETDAFDDFEQSLHAGVLEDIARNLERTDIRLAFPSFEFEFGAQLADALAALGMVDAFEAGVADFSGMIGEGTDEKLFISSILHKAFIKLDENGTEAAAATVVMMEGAAAAPTEPIEVTIDRPFLFAIRDTETGTLLFLGRVLNPAG